MLQQNKRMILFVCFLVNLQSLVFYVIYNIMKKTYIPNIIPTRLSPAPAEIK